MQRRIDGPKSDRDYLYDVRLSTFVGSEAQQSSDDEPRDAAVTPVVKGLEMSIGFDQPAYRADEPIRLEVIINNITEEEVSLDMTASDLSRPMTELRPTLSPQRPRATVIPPRLPKTFESAEVEFAKLYEYQQFSRLNSKLSRSKMASLGI